MELNSELINCLHKIHNDPMLVTIWATFGVPLFMAVLGLPFILLRIIGIRQAKSIYGFLSIILAFNWLTGFLSQIAFLFLGVPGIKMLLLWAIMFFIYAAFVSLNYSYIKKWIDKNSKVKS